MGIFDRNKSDDEQGKDGAAAPPPPPAGDAQGSGAPPPPPPAAEADKRDTWLDEEEDDRAAAAASSPVTADQMESRSESKSDAQVTKEPPPASEAQPSGVYDPDADPYNTDKIPGAQAREEYARSLVPPGGDPEDEYRWHTGRIRDSGNEDAVEFIEVHKAFGRNKILRGLNMGIPNDKISMILGPSGTGKSVCIKHMVGLLYPDEGDVLVHGESIPNMVDDRLFEVRKKFGVLFQDGALFGSMNLYDNVCFPLRQHTDKGEDEIEDIVMRRLREVGLEAALDKMPNELSGGMRKRAGFARALVLDPDIVLFDEPDSGLDPVRTALLCELIQEVHEENGGAYVVITHDIMSAKRVAEHISVLWKGRIVESGPAEELFNSENMFVRQFLSGASRGPLGME